MVHRPASPPSTSTPPTSPTSRPPPSHTPSRTMTRVGRLRCYRLGVTRVTCPGLAVDGDPDTCSVTPRTPELRWWQVRLAAAELVQRVAVTIEADTRQHFS